MHASSSDTAGICCQQITVYVKKSRRCGLEHSNDSTCFLQLHPHMGERLQAGTLGEGLD